MVNPKPSGFASTKEGKRKVVERTKALVDESSFIICVPYEGVDKENTDKLKSMLPETVTASVVKNTLMKLALQESDFESMSEKLNNENMFLFVPEVDFSLFSPSFLQICIFSINSMFIKFRILISCRNFYRQCIFEGRNQSNFRCFQKVAKGG